MQDEKLAKGRKYTLPCKGTSQPSICGEAKPPQLAFPNAQVLRGVPQPGSHGIVQTMGGHKKVEGAVSNPQQWP